MEFVGEVVVVVVVQSSSGLLHVFVVNSYYITSFATLKRIASQDMNVYYAITLVVFSTYTYVVNIFFNQPLCHANQKSTVHTRRDDVVSFGHEFHEACHTGTCGAH